MTDFSFTLHKTLGQARAGTISTPHGEIPTPIFMPVGTQASVKSLDSEDLKKTESPIILANTYHLYLRPGMETMQSQGGIHEFMKWDRPILTDSGGFQVFSLGAQQMQRTQQKTSQVKITDESVEFTSYLDGSKHLFTPEKAIEIQRQIGADIIMAFDECTPDTASVDAAAAAVSRTYDWAQRCKNYWESHERRNVYGRYQALFGIVQGAFSQELRRQATQQIVGLDFDGVAIGGETIGYNMERTVEVMSWLQDLLPEGKPRYAMGLGSDPQNVVDAVEAGIDMFDCVAPTRLARNGALYFGHLEETGRGEANGRGQFLFASPYKNARLNIGNAQFAQDSSVIQGDCDCATCRAGYSRAYLHHLFRTKELSYYRLASVHNVRTMIRLTQQLRIAILKSH